MAEALAEREVLLKVGRAPRLAGALRHAARARAAAALDDPRGPVSLRPPLAAREPAGLEGGAARRAALRLGPASRSSSTASSIPIAASTTRAWWWRTRWMRASAARAS